MADLRIAGVGRSVSRRPGPERLFVGLHLDQSRWVIEGALVRVWGSGLSAVPDLIASATYPESQLATLIAADADVQNTRVMAELAARVVNSLLSQAKPQVESLRTVGLLNFGRWSTDPLGDHSFQPVCDAHHLAAQSRMTVVDDWIASDQSHGGRGGPLEVLGAWLMLADRGLMPGRVIRAVIDLDQSAQLLLLPPRQGDRLPAHLKAYEVAPVISLLDGIVTRYGIGSRFDVREQLAVQGTQVPELMSAWDEALKVRDSHWSPGAFEPGPLLQRMQTWAEDHQHSGCDMLCTATCWIAQRIAEYVQRRVPASQPIGQLILAGPARQHSFLHRQLRELLPELPLQWVDDVGYSQPWRAAAAALLGCLHVDQVSADTESLTGAATPRILGSVTPGHPSNWHQVLADMAQTLPEKKSLRSAM